jgi:protein-tyrosine phosphatase
MPYPAKYRLIFLSFLALSYVAPAMALAGKPETKIEATQTEGQRVLPIPGISNFRDLGGYETSEGRVTKWGRLYRSGDFSRFPPAGQETLSALGITTIVDFRSKSEKERAPTRWYDDTKPTTINLPIGDNAADWSSELSQQLQSGVFTAEEIHLTFIDMYESIPLENAAEYTSLFNNILSQDGAPLLFHCTAGKDRTGIGAALILSALDVPRATIMEDFMLTNEAVNLEVLLPMLAKIFGKQAGTEIDPESIRPIGAVDQIFLESSFTSIEVEYGTIDRYLEEALGLTSEKRGQLKELLLQ